MKTLSITFGPVFVITMLSIGTAGAVTPLSGSEFRRMCSSFAEQPYGTTGVPCSAYIHGFLGGAHASGIRRDERLSENKPERSAFMERATRTRLGRPIDRYGSYYSAGYCVPKDETLAGVVETVINYLKSREPTETETANQLVLAALNKGYPCPNK